MQIGEAVSDAETRLYVHVKQQTHSQQNGEKS